MNVAGSPIGMDNALYVHCKGIAHFTAREGQGSRGSELPGGNLGSPSSVRTWNEKSVQAGEPKLGNPNLVPACESSSASLILNIEILRKVFSLSVFFFFLCGACGAHCSNMRTRAAPAAPSLVLRAEPPSKQEKKHLLFFRRLLVVEPRGGGCPPEIS